MPGSLGRLSDAFGNTDVGDDDADDSLTGSAANDRLLGLGGNDQFDGADGNDRLFGGDDADRFVVGLDEGDDPISGFEVAEVIDLSGTGIANFADLLIDDGALGTLTDGQTLTFRGIEAAELNATDFLFADDGDANDADDLVDLSGVIDVTAFDDLNIADSDAGAAGGGTLTFQGLAAADLAAESFIFDEDGETVIAGTDGDDVLAGTEANDTFLLQPDGGNDTIVGFQQGDLLDVSAAGLASFDALELLDFDDGAVLTIDDGTSVTFDGLEAAELDAFDFLLDT